MRFSVQRWQLTAAYHGLLLIENSPQSAARNGYSEDARKREASGRCGEPCEALPAALVVLFDSFVPVVLFDSRAGGASATTSAPQNRGVQTVAVAEVQQYRRRRRGIEEDTDIPPFAHGAAVPGSRGGNWCSRAEHGFQPKQHGKS